MLEQTAHEFTSRVKPYISLTPSDHTTEHTVSTQRSHSLGFQKSWAVLLSTGVTGYWSETSVVIALHKDLSRSHIALHYSHTTL